MRILCWSGTWTVMRVPAFIQREEVVVTGDDVFLLGPHAGLGTLSTAYVIEEYDIALIVLCIFVLAD